MIRSQTSAEFCTKVEAQAVIVAAFIRCISLLVPAARQAADEQSVRRVLTMLSTTPGRSLFIGAFAYDGVAFLFSPGRTVSYPFLVSIRYTACFVHFF